VPPPAVAIKTVYKLADLRVLRSIPEGQLLNTKFVLMVRDPRARLYSTVKANWTWETIYGPMSCRDGLLQWLSAKEIMHTLPKDSLRVAFYEHWSQQVETFAPSLFQWAGFPMSADVRASAVSSKKDSALAWTKSLGNAMTEKMNNAPYCKKYLDLVGYPSSPSSLRDFSNLRTQFAAELTSDQRQLLANIRQEVHDEENYAP
jgi:hypothetical protein